ncbi:hypothetical protein ACMFMG_004560 [Clarireedia jacksonii]
MAPSENTTQQTRKSRQPKLPAVIFRSSCDLCTEAKVRCDKQHPQCGRCIRIGSSCRYSVSMRTGKPTIEFIKALNAGKLQMPPTSHAAGASETEQSSRGTIQIDPSQLPDVIKSLTPPASDSAPSPIPKEQYKDLDLSLDHELRLPDPTSPFHPVSTAQDNDMGIQMGHSTGSPCHDPMDGMNIMDYLFTNGDDFTLPELDPPSPSFSNPLSSITDSECFSHLDFTKSEPSWHSHVIASNNFDHNTDDGNIFLNSHIPQPQTPPHEHSCVREAKSLQKSVIMMTSRGDTMQQEHNIMCSPSPIITTDQALLMCSSITKQLIEILRCSCDANVYLPFLLSVIISQVLAAYGAIAKVDDTTPFSHGNIPKQQTQQDQNAFVSVPLRLGAYNVDGEIEGRLRAQLVLHELSKLECAVQLFVDKYSHCGREEKLGEERFIYSALGQFIKHRYSRVKAACELRSPSPTMDI